MPKLLPLFISLKVLVLFAVAAQSLYAQNIETAIVNNASAVLDEVMRVPAKAIPKSLLAKAHGVVIIPGMMKGGFIVGVRYGRGVALVRNVKGGWDLPRLVQMTGGSVGFQAGVQSTDVILVFMTKKSVDGLMHGKFTIGADVAAAAGPVGRQVSAATDERLRAEILSYSRSRGLFAGVALDGSSLQLDLPAEMNFYGPPQDGRYTTMPKPAAELAQKVASYTHSTEGSAVSQDGRATSKAAAPEPGSTREQLASAAIKLSAVLPEQWSRYLALPAEVYDSNEEPSVDSLKHVLGRFDKVAKDPRYRALAERGEFQTTHALLQKYYHALTPTRSQQLQLPPPPKEEVIR